MAETIKGTEAAPSKATDAVLKPSEFSTADATEVTGIDFNKYVDRNLTVAELVDNMSTMGFQATSVGEAVKLVNKMVSLSFTNKTVRTCILDHDDSIDGLLEPI